VTNEDRRAVATRAIDANPNTYWHTAEENVDNFPHQVTIDLGKLMTIKGFFYTPVQHSDANSGTIYQYSFLVSEDGDTWEKVIEQGTFANIKNNPVQQRVSFNQSYRVRFIQLVSHTSVNGDEMATS